MTQSDKANAFAALHVKGDPVILYNIWDVGSAKIVADAGAKAIATGSWSVAAAQGFADGESIPLDLVLTIISRIATSVDLPLTVDFEGGYAEDPETITKNVTRIINAGAIGVNFEDQRIGGSGLYGIDEQHQRVKAVKEAANATGIPLFINARTDLFLKEPARDKHAALIAEAKERATAYKQAGADCFFVPGLIDAALIADICDAVALPVNIMKKAGVPPISDLASLGVARISYGPGPYFTFAEMLAQSFRDANSGK